MSLKVGTAVVKPDDEYSDGKKLVRSAREDGDIQSEDFGMLFTATSFDFRSLVEGLEDEIDSEWMGGTTIAEVSPEGFSEGTAVFMLIESDEVEFSAVSSSKVHEDPEGSAREAMEELESYLDQEVDNRLIFTLVPGFTQASDGVEFKFLKGMEAELESEISIVGGSTGDGLALRENYRFRNGEVLSDGAVMALIQTDHEIVTGQSHGFDESVATGVVTKADGRFLEEVKGEPAAEFYAEAIGADRKELGKLFDLPFKQKVLSAARYSWLKLRGKDPIMVHQILNYSHEYAIGREVGKGEYRVISPIEVKGQSIKLLDEIREGQAIHVLKGDDESIIDAGGKAFEQLAPEETALGLITDCANRYFVMDQDEMDEEIAAMREKLGEKFIGFYGEGEIGDGGLGMCTFVNQTVTGFAIKKE